MKTSKPLKQLIPDMIAYVGANYESHVKYNGKLIDISNGNLLPYVEESMAKELNPRAYERSVGRIPPINIINKLQTKISKVYAEAPERTVGGNAIDNEIFEDYISFWELNDKLQYANDLLVINKYCALEPYMLNGEPKMRVLSAKDFLPFSDSKVNPNEMTVFIKFMGSISKLMEKKYRGKDQYKQVGVFHAYSEDEFISFDEDGEVYMEEVNPYGAIPFIYLRSNSNELLPTPDSDNLPMATLIPKLMADLNYSVMFGCRSQIVGIDVEMDNVEFSPDSLWLLNSVDGDGKSPSLDTIKSDVDVEKVLELINNQLGLWLDTKGIKTGSVGTATVQNAASGISKLIDESDASAVNRRYKSIFQVGEKRLFKLLPKLHNVWLMNGESDFTRDFSADYNPRTELIDAKVIPNRKELLEEMKLEDELGIFNKREALKRLNPDMSDTDLDEKVAELEDDGIVLNMNNEDNTEE